MRDDPFPPIVRLSPRGAEVRGAWDGRVRVFRGVPYARPPVGPLRWRPPAPLEPGRGTIDATAFGPDPLQAERNPGYLGTRASGQSEDCLHLNVWTPAEAEALPVMVWSPGGGFVGGSGSNVTYDGRRLAERGVVVVTINYRVGALGWLCHPELAERSEHGVSGNYGLLDQVAALRWVREHIAGFGGDPGNVTAFGHSAGATSISYLLTSPLAAGLIDKAILQSPGAMRGLMPHDEAAARGAALGRLEDLLTLSDAELIGLDRALAPGFRKVVGPRALGPVLDGWALPREEWDAYGQGLVRPVPLLIGAVADEGEVIGREQPFRTVETYLAYVRDCFGEEDDAALAHYGAGAASGLGRAVSDLFGDTQFVFGVRALARAMARIQPRSFLYWFDARRAGQAASPTHGDELPYVFGTLDEPFDGQSAPYGPGDRALSDLMMTAWTSFARHGAPEVVGGAWPATGGDDTALYLGTRAHAAAFPRAAPLDFLERVLGRGAAVRQASG